MNDQIAYDVKVRTIHHEINSALIGDVDDANIRSIIGSDVYDEIVALKKAIRVAVDPADKKTARQAAEASKMAAARAAADR